MEQKEQQAQLRKKQQQLASCETRISELEAKNKEIDARLLLPETGIDLILCQQLAEEQEAIQQELNSLYEQWETLADML